MKPLHETLILKVRDSRPEETTDQVAAEIGFSLVVNDIQVVTLLCTPGELDAMAVGFLLSEGILENRDSLQNIEVDEEKYTVTVSLKNIPENIDRTFHKKTVTSGCGQGITYTDASSLRDIPANRSPLRVSPEQVKNLLREFRSASGLFAKTGGVHSAALTDGEKIILFAEDIGRHNAVDKLIGKAFLTKIPVDDKILLSSGRVSGEIMTKSIRNRIPILVSRAAPTCMSITLAEDHGITLIGFARSSRMNIYTHPQRVMFDGQE